MDTVDLVDWVDRMDKDRVKVSGAELFRPVHFVHNVQQVHNVHQPHISTHSTSSPIVAALRSAIPPRNSRSPSIPSPETAEMAKTSP